MKISDEAIPKANEYIHSMPNTYKKNKKTDSLISIHPWKVGINSPSASYNIQVELTIKIFEVEFLSREDGYEVCSADKQKTRWHSFVYCSLAQLVASVLMPSYFPTPLLFQMVLTSCFQFIKIGRFLQFQAILSLNQNCWMLIILSLFLFSHCPMAKSPSTLSFGSNLHRIYMACFSTKSS